MMKYKGKKLEGRNTDVLVLMRGDTRIVFKAQALEDYEDFDKLCPTPDPPIKMRPGGIKEENTRDPAYLVRLEEYAQKRTNYSIVKSLEISEDVAWDIVDLTKPDTWEKWKGELKDAGFTEIEIVRVLNLCINVNCLNEELLDKAKEDFLAEALLPEE